MKDILTIILILVCSAASAQSKNQGYIDSLTDYRKNYIESHEVVKDNDRKFLSFYPVDPQYRISCKFEKIANGKWFSMLTSGKERQIYRKVGRLSFSIHDTVVHLYIYQSQSLMTNKMYKDYLFIPFTDLSSGIETYGGGRYLECFLDDIKNNRLLLDFNKAYNPYCAYSAGYNCPIPPKENDLPVAIRAGEKNYGKPTH